MDPVADVVPVTVGQKHRGQGWNVFRLVTRGRVTGQERVDNDVASARFDERAGMSAKGELRHVGKPPVDFKRLEV
jgi:hypothetical protein